MAAATTSAEPPATPAEPGGPLRRVARAEEVTRGTLPSPPAVAPHEPHPDASALCHPWRMTAIARLCWTAIDCPDARALAGFYSAITGWPIDEARSDDEWVHLAADGAITLCFQQVEDYHAPQWPGQEHPQQEHLDFYVDDLEAGEEAVLALGARLHAVQPGESFRVYLDPADHPFCLIRSGSE